MDGTTFSKRRTMPRQVRIELAGAIYHVVAREDRLFAKGSRKVAASNRVA
jgi:hypothetical protein